MLIKAFEDVEYSDKKEHELVEALRKSENYIPELSIVAKVDNKIVGYILCTEVNIINGEDTNKALAIAPFAVLPEYRNEKIGSKMIKRAFTKANKLGYKGIVVLGYKSIFVPSLLCKAEITVITPFTSFLHLSFLSFTAHPQLLFSFHSSSQFSHFCLS